MNSHYKRAAGQTGFWQENRYRPEVNDEFEPPPATEKQALFSRLLTLLTQVSEDVMRGAVIGVIAATPCLRRLLWRIVFGAALTGAVLAAVIIRWLASLAPM